MTGLKYYERTKLLIELIEARKTGSPGELARKLGVSQRMVYHIINDLRLAIEMGIEYSKKEKSYIFSEEN